MSEMERLEARLGAWAAAPDIGADWEDVRHRAGSGIPTRRFPRRRRLVLAAAVVIASAVAAAIAVFGFGASARPGNAGAAGPTGPLGPPGPTVDHPLVGGRPVSLADAKAAFGAPLVLPDTSPMGSPDPGPLWLATARVDSTSVIERVVAATYPSARLWIDYETGANVDHDNVLLLYKALAHGDPRYRLLDIDGVPALAFIENPDGPPGGVMFQVAGIRVTVVGHQDDSTLLALARSIINGYASPPAGQLGEVGGIQLFTYLPPGRRIDLADASATLRAPVALPDTPLASSSNAGQVWSEGSCPVPEGPIVEQSEIQPCWIWISFPVSGLSVGYLRPLSRRGTPGEWDQQAKHYGDNASVIELGDVPALAIEPEDPYPGSVEFDLGRTRIVVAGQYDTATLKEVAQSIVDRATG